MAKHLGAVPRDDNRCRFRVWAPLSDRVHLHLVRPKDSVICMEPKPRGYHDVLVEKAGPGTRYVYGLSNGKEFPDPASRFQPEGVHGPSEVVDLHFEWRDSHWFGLPIDSYIIYELHVGAFTPEGTFDAVIPHLDELAEVGITAIELMPVAQFPGVRNWGYDGVYPYAVQSSYGGTAGLKRLVAAAHARGMAVVLDVVYNHLGPEGNYFRHFGPYFSEQYLTPWGDPMN